MTQTVTGETPPPPPDSPDVPPPAPRSTQRLLWARRHRGPAAAIMIALVAILAILYMQLAPKGDTVPLSTLNAGPDGGRAASEILTRHGVEVRSAGSYDAALAALRSRPDATLLLYDRNGFLDGPQLAQLRIEAARMVVITPRFTTLAALDSGITQAGVVPEAAPTLDAGCSNPDAEAAGPVAGDPGFLYAAGNGVSACYRPPGSEAGLLATTADGALTVLGSTAVLSNAGLDEEGHAALSLRILGGTPDLVWYLPGLADVSGPPSPQTLNDLAPGWVPFLGPWLVLVAAVAIIWRGRRFGPLVFEPLPVVVKAAETAEGRARLYHDSHAVDRARDNLRAGTLVRLARELRLGVGVSADDVADAAARALDRPAPAVRELINEHPPNEARLVRWSQELDKLEKEVGTR